MLPERQVRLLTAYVDGELTSAQQRQVTRLLKRSAEARTLLAHLQADSRQLIELPPVPAPIDFSAPVLAAIGQGKPRTAPRPRPAPRMTFPAWGGWAAAAAVLLAVGMGSFLSYSGTRPGKSGQTTHHRQPAPNDNHEAAPDGSGLAQVNPGNGKAEDDTTPDLPKDGEGPRQPKRNPEEKSDTPKGSERSTVKPLPDDRPEGPVLGAPSDQKDPLASAPLERVDLALPVVHQLSTLDRASNAGKLREQLATGKAFRVELLARDATRGFERVRSAAAQRKLALLIDAVAVARLKKPWKSDYALFVENITPANLVAFLQAIARADRQAKAGEQRFDGSLVVKEMSRWDRKELTDLLGVDPTSVRPAPSKKQARLDIRRPLSERTAIEVAEILDGKRKPRPGASQQGQTALVLPLSGSHARSPEVRLFLQSRKPGQAGTVQVFLVLRNLPR
jgi:hypothetical protein